MKPFHGFCLAAPRSGEGKTTVSIALMRLFARRGLAVQAFKCGPDYIDPSFHAEASGQPACNLDTWMMGKVGVQSLWNHRAQTADIAICEGVMGLFDSRDVGDLAGSTADCALCLAMPVVLVFNARGMAGSVTALASGFYHQAKQLGIDIVGFIANNVGSPRHTEILRDALNHANLPPLLGALPRREAWTLPERQLGLLPSKEVGTNAAWFDRLADEAAEYIDTEQLLALSVMPRPAYNDDTAQQIARPHKNTKRMGIAKDHAFCFYYEENERSLIRQGWELIPFSPISDAHIPANIDALYLGGGYPEVFARELSENTSMRDSIKQFAENDGAIYAECGGYMYLCTSLETPAAQEDTAKVHQNATKRHGAHDTHGDAQPPYTAYPMCSVINATARMGTRIRSLGYRAVDLLTAAPFDLPKTGFSGTHFRGHEFHWSDITLHQSYPPLYTVQTRNGVEQNGLEQNGLEQNGVEQAGIVYKNVQAGYIHLYWGYGSYHEQAATCKQTSSDLNPTKQKNSGQLILLNGPSSAGKTSLSKALQKHIETQYAKPCMVLSIDQLLRASTGAHESVLEGIESTGLPFIETFHASIAAATQAGAWVIADHVIGEQDLWIRDLLARLGDTSILSIQLSCAMDVLQERELHRTDRTPNWEHAARQAKTIHKPLPNQLYIDTTSNTPDDCARQILQALSAKCQQIAQPNQTAQASQEVKDTL